MVKFPPVIPNSRNWTQSIQLYNEIKTIDVNIALILMFNVMTNFSNSILFFDLIFTINQVMKRLDSIMLFWVNIITLTH